MKVEMELHFITQTGNVAFTTDYYIDSKIFPSTNKLNQVKMVV